MNQSDLRKTDVLSGFLFALVGFLAAVSALRMPKPTGLAVPAAYLTYPGSMPLLVGLLLLIGGLLLSWNGYRSASFPGREDVRRVRAGLTSPLPRRLAAVGVPFLLYTTTLLGLLPFWLATASYLILVMLALGSAARVTIVVVALGVSLGLHLLFGVLLQLPLP